MATNQQEAAIRPEELIGRVFDGRYRVVELIGTGAMALIFRAEQDEEPHQVALKVLPAEMARHKTASARFHREAKAASKLDHPGIIKVLSWGVEGELPFIAMELLDGEDLFELLQRKRKLDPERAICLVIRLCEALGAAHRIGIVHRDLKPENVMVLPPDKRGEDERVRVLDFGIAKLLDPRVGGWWDDETLPAVLTKAGSAVGTPSHMAPEQARGEELDGRADVYASGVLLYEMLTGHLPFEGDNPILVAVRQVRDPPPPPSTYLPSLDPELEQVVLRCLEKAPDDRFDSAEALESALRKVLDRLRSGVEPGEGTFDEDPTRRDPLDADELSTRQIDQSELSTHQINRSDVITNKMAAAVIDEETVSLEVPTLEQQGRRRRPRVTQPSAELGPPRARQGTEIMTDAVEHRVVMVPSTLRSGGMSDEPKPTSSTEVGFPLPAPSSSVVPPTTRSAPTGPPAPAPADAPPGDEDEAIGDAGPAAVAGTTLERLLRDLPDDSSNLPWLMVLLALFGTGAVSLLSWLGVL